MGKSPEDEGSVQLQVWEFAVVTELSEQDVFII